VLWETGTGNLGLSLNSAGTRMFWYPAKAAFRAGAVDVGGEWNDGSIGYDSAAFGYCTTASGPQSFAAGCQAIANNGCAVAIGFQTVASGGNSQAFGFKTTASNYNATALGSGTSAGGGSGFATGGATSASGPNSMAIGGYTTASGYDSLAAGHQTVAYGMATFASGFNNQAWADYSASFGFGNFVDSYADLVAGCFAVGVGPGTTSATSWGWTDPLFELGNGASTSARSDAFVVYKNGNAILQGNLQVAPSSDIPMYQSGD